MKTAVLIARILLGVIFVVFGLNGFLQFLPQPEMPPAAVAFFGGLAASGFMLPTLFATPAGRQSAAAARHGAARGRHPHACDRPHR